MSKSATSTAVAHVYKAPKPHWVGDGFYVHSMFNYNETHKNVDPFLLMDYAAPHHYEANSGEHLRGVGEHPHRGFETVTIAFDGEVEHADSHGGGGVIGTGDVQWMTAGAGIMHQEFHSKAFAKTGGLFEMVQLWVNLPKKDKMTTPSYQAIKSDDIPAVDLDGKGEVRIIAGEMNGRAGTAKTFSPINLWDITLKAGQSHHFDVPKSHNVLLLVRQGTISIDGQQATSAELVTFHQECDGFTVNADSDSKLLLLSGEPLGEPIAGYGPFVMNSDEEIRQALHDLKTGQFGNI